MSPRKFDSGGKTKNTKRALKSPKESSARSTRKAVTSKDSKRVHDRIALRAYALYEERGYRHGWDLQDWLDAEREILSHELRS
ncbi:DUF2934 domain-containing protein [Petrachloros mirabilis]